MHAILINYSLHQMVGSIIKVRHIVLNIAELNKILFITFNAIYTKTVIQGTTYSLLPFHQIPTLALFPVDFCLVAPSIYFIHNNNTHMTVFPLVCVCVCHEVSTVESSSL